MTATIPTPFNFGRTETSSDPLFDSNDTSDGGTLDVLGGDSTGTIRQGGGLPSDTGGTQLTVNSGKAGIRYYLNSTPSPLDFTSSGEKRVLLFGTQAQNTIRRQIATVASGGQSLKMYSGSDTTSEIREWVLGGSDTLLATRAGIFLFAVDPEANGTVADVGSFDASDVLRYGHFNTQGDMVGSTPAFWFWAGAVLVSSEKDSTEIPRVYGSSSSWQDLVDAVQGTTDFSGQNHLYVEKSGEVVSLFCPCSIGNASQTSPSVTTFNDGGVTVISPASNSTSDPRFHLTTDSMRVYLDLRDNASDTATFSGSYIWGTQAPFDFSQSDNASIILSGASFSGMGQFTCGSSVSGTATFSLGGTSKVVMNGADLTGSTINGDAQLAGNSVSTLTNLTVTGALDFNTAGAYILNDCVIDEVTNSSGGLVALLLNSGSSITTNTGPNTAVYLMRNISVTGLTAGSRLRIYNTTTSTEVYNEVVSGTSYTYSYAEGAGYSENDVLEVRVTEVSKLEFSSSVVVSSTGWSLLVSQETNSTYASYGVDGSTVTGITWDGGNMQFDFNDPDNTVQGGDIAAWYFYFITTETGISEAFGAISWPQINRISNRTATKAITFDNTKSDPLKITNTFIDRDDGATIIASSSNSIQIDPPAVFVKETDTSGLTAAESAQLANATLIPALL